MFGGVFGWVKESVQDAVCPECVCECPTLSEQLWDAAQSNLSAIPLWSYATMTAAALGGIVLFMTSGSSSKNSGEWPIHDDAISTVILHNEYDTSVSSYVPPRGQTFITQFFDKVSDAVDTVTQREQPNRACKKITPYF